MKLTKKDSLYMHPLPADRGNEVTDDVIDGSHSVVFDEAENRLHTCKAIMALTMSKKPVPYEVEAKTKSAAKKKLKARRAGA
jgi:aspartate carbamoyltransferase catalytic subunit